MKTPLSSLFKKIVPCLLVASSAQAELAWVKSPFWQAPIEKNVSVKISTTHKNLQTICDEYRSSILTKSGKVALEASEVDYFRMDSEGMFGGKFSATFSVQEQSTKVANQASLEASAQAVNAKASQDPLPLYTQAASEIVPQVQPRGEIVVVGAPGSLVEISKSLGLKPGKVQSFGADYLATVKVFGRDAVCDLATGQARIEFESTAVVKISIEDQKRIDEFYRGVESLTNSVFAKRKSNTSRAALFGYRMVDTLAPLRLDSERQELFAANLIDYLFDANMQRNALWKNLNNQPHLTVHGSAEAVVNIRMEK